MRFPRWAPAGVLCAMVATVAVAAPPVTKVVAQVAAPSAAPTVKDAAIRDELAVAVRALWAANPEVQSARAELEAARARAVAASRPLYNPSIDAGIENADVRRRTIGLSLPLDLSGKRGARTAVGAADLQAVEASYDRARRDVAARWLKAWLASALANQEEALGKRRLELMQSFDELAGKRLKVGDVSSPERDLAALALGEAQTQQATLLGRVAAARAALQSLGDTGLDRLPAFAGQLPPELEGADLVRSDTKIDELPELREARSRTDAAYAGVKVAERNRIPDPVISLTGGRVNIAPSGPGPGGRLNYNVVGVGLSIPLPIRNTYSAEVNAARADADAAAANLGTQRLSVRARLSEALSRYQALRTAGQSFRASRASAFDERTRLLERLWNAGEITTSDYLIQLKQSLDTALSGLQLQSETWQAFIDYQVAADRLTAWVASDAVHGNDKEYAQ
ncbi:TolC family protein [Dyella silvatica]|uniref:TolC family protein n=1 Tax=Dyella silvatica TaxID=2992128 RepID=UPI002256A561|nr:TolC family protein [Dyella silvatica]